MSRKVFSTTTSSAAQIAWLQIATWGVWNFAWTRISGANTTPSFAIA